jgi:hypothetical protein
MSTPYREAVSFNESSVELVCRGSTAPVASAYQTQEPSPTVGETGYFLGNTVLGSPVLTV